MTMALHRPRTAVEDRTVTSKDAADASSRSQTLHDERKCTIRASVPLMLGVALEIYVVSLTVLGDPRPAVGIALAVALLFAALWFALPWLRRMGSAA
jgi:hypothetical protein